MLQCFSQRRTLGLILIRAYLKNLSHFLNFGNDETRYFC